MTGLVNLLDTRLWERAIIAVIIGAGITIVGTLVWATRVDRRGLGTPDPLGSRHNPMEGRIILIIGRLGDGKTSYAVARALNLARRHHLPLIANCDVRPEAQRIYRWEDLEELVTCADLGVPCVHDQLERGGYRCPGCHPAVVLLDEVHLWLPSRQTLVKAEETRRAAELLSWVRKRGWTVIATTQYLTRVSTELRNLTTEIVQVRPVSAGFVHRVEMLDDQGRPGLGFVGVFSPRRANFNTRAEVVPLWAKRDDDAEDEDVTV